MRRPRIRIAIREQLAALVIIAVLVALAVVAIPTWVFVDQFVNNVQTESLALTASLKAARIASELSLVQTACRTIASRMLLQQALIDYYNGNSTAGTDVWDAARKDLLTALNTGGLSDLLQAKIYSRNTTGDHAGLLNVTAPGLGNGSNLNIQLPYYTADGQLANLSNNVEWGYSPQLYPNITYVDLNRTSSKFNGTEAFSAEPFPGMAINTKDLLLGPLIVNQTFALISLTIPIVSNNVNGFNLGYMTMVASAASIIEVTNSAEGMGTTGAMLLVGPTNPSNKFNESLAPSNATYKPDYDAFRKSPVRFLFPPKNVNDGIRDRHTERNINSGQYDKPFELQGYSAVLQALFEVNSQVNNALGIISTRNEQGVSVAVGAALTPTTLANWAIVVEQTRAEAHHPIQTLESILLGCVFGTLGLAALLIFPFAHWSVMPIRRLQEATEKAVMPPGSQGFTLHNEANPRSEPSRQSFSKGPLNHVWGSICQLWRGRTRALGQREKAIDFERAQFKIPVKVQVANHFVTDELTELTLMFNNMADELLKQYTQLDEKVAERTKELEISKKAAEAANESKTLFIANISHEIRTPLNGILGSAAVCMEEDDLVCIKQSLKTLYKSGDLLLHLLEDLLSFSKNQIGFHQISLEEKEFRLGDVTTQIMSIFEKQARDKSIAFATHFVATETVSNELEPGLDKASADTKLPAMGPAGAGRLSDMCVWGDQHRILQVIINLVSNSLKFTPAGGRIDVRIRCVGEADRLKSHDSRTLSVSRVEVGRGGRVRSGVGSNSSTSHSNSSKDGTALAINPMDSKAVGHMRIRDRDESSTPPLASVKTYFFVFEVQDTGPGIPEALQRRVFEPFVQGDLGLSKKFGGTGLGLSICAQLATLMSGDIAVKSQVGVGSTFAMQIPLKHTKNRPPSIASNSSMTSKPGSIDMDRRDLKHSLTRASSPEKRAAVAMAVGGMDKQPRLVGLSQPFFAATPSPTISQQGHIAAIDRAVAKKPDPGKLRILVADDNAINVEVVCKLLKLEDVVEVDIAQDGLEAIEMVKQTMEQSQRYDVIFMDIMMPNLDGLQSTRMIRKMGYSAPIVALTAFSDFTKCLESGMDECLAKPIRRPALKQVLRRFATIVEEPENSTAIPKTEPNSAANQFERLAT